MDNEFELRSTSKYVTLDPEEVIVLKKMVDRIYKQSDPNSKTVAGIELAAVVNFIIETKGI